MTQGGDMLAEGKSNRSSEKNGSWAQFDTARGLSGVSTTLLGNGGVLAFMGGSGG